MNAARIMRAVTRRTRIRGRHGVDKGHRAPAAGAVLGRKPGVVCGRPPAR